MLSGKVCFSFDYYFLVVNLLLLILRVCLLINTIVLNIMIRIFVSFVYNLTPTNNDLCRKSATVYSSAMNGIFVITGWPCIPEEDLKGR